MRPRRRRFARGPRCGTVRAFLENPATVQAPCATPWRYIHVAKDAVALANAQPAVMDALNAPSRVADTSWIKPGKVIRVARLTTKDGKDCVDFVKRNGLQYIEIDAGWYGPEQKGNPLKPALDPRRAVKGESFDLQAILAYANYNEGKLEDTGGWQDANKSKLGFLLGNESSKLASGGNVPSLISTALNGKGEILDPWGHPYQFRITAGDIDFKPDVLGNNVKTGFRLPNFYRISEDER